MLKQITLLLLVSLASYTNGECDDGWRNYKNELCVRTFNKGLTYDQAVHLCLSKPLELLKSPATPLMIKEPEFEDFLKSLSRDEDFVGNFWLGGRFNDETSEFKWKDGESVTYSNWADGYPKKTTDSDACIVLQNTGTRKWIHSSCKEKNLVVCQKPFKRTLEDAFNDIKQLQKQQQLDRKLIEEISKKVGLKQ